LFTTIMGICEKRVALWGRKDDGFPFNLRNLQDDLVAVALGSEIAGCLSESIDGWCTDREVPISVKEGSKLAPAQEARGIGGIFLSREGRVEPLRKSLDSFGKEAVALLEYSWRGVHVRRRWLSIGPTLSLVYSGGSPDSFTRGQYIRSTRGVGSISFNTRRDVKECWTFWLLRRSSGRSAKSRRVVTYR
jgi:hypothetical protein